MARPKLDIDAQQVFKLAKLLCTTEEIAEFFGCSRDTLERRFAAELAKGRQVRKMSLRRAQFRAAFNGNPALLIWLGKQHLGQADKIESKTEVRSFVSPDEQRAMLDDQEALDLACRLDERIAGDGRRNGQGTR